MGNGRKAKTHASLPTVSENVEKQQNLERLQQQQEKQQSGRRKSTNMDIMFSKLVFTTNKQGISNSVSVSTAKIPQTAQIEAADTSAHAHAHAQKGSVVIEEVPKRRMSFKNLKGLKLNTNVKIGKNESNTAEPLIPDEASGTVCVKNLAKQFDFQDRRKNDVDA